MTNAGFDQLLASQRGRCAICKGPPSVFDVFTVDHDHDTGMVRGLLCQHCNTGISRFKDSTKIMANAIKYIYGSRTNKYRELEIKLEVPKTGQSTEFIKWLSLGGLGVTKYTRTTGQDVYWEKDGAVVRQRLHTSRGPELTVKKRIKEGSNTDRVEVDLVLPFACPKEDVAAFQTVLGYKPLVILTKTSHIFTINTEDCLLTLVYYEVKNDLLKMPKRGFVEVEIDKEADIPISKATKILENWKKILTDKGLILVSKSLWELYSYPEYKCKDV